MAKGDEPATQKKRSRESKRDARHHVNAEPGSWLHHGVAIGSAGLAAMAGDAALRLHAGLHHFSADVVGSLSFAGLCALHFAMLPRRVRVAPALIEQDVSQSRNPGAPVPAVAAAAPVSTRAAAPAAPIDHSPPVADASALQGFEHLQSLVAELARSTPGPKAATPDPDAGMAIQQQYAPPSPSAQAAVGASALAQAAQAMAFEHARPAELRARDSAMELEDALDAGRMTVYLEPIQQIEFDRARHYEVSVRFSAADGREFAHDETLAVARDAGLLPRVDAAVLPRAARIAQHFQLRGRNTEILSRVHGESLPDQDFRAEVTAATIAADGAALVLSFAQDDVRGFGPIHWEILSTIAEMGLRFAIEAVTDLDMDFDGLKRRGFNFVKLDADVLLDGLPAAGGVIASADVCRHFAGAGLALIVNHIDDEQVLARLLGFGVLFGQGALFGTPRAVRADILSMSAAA